MDPEEVSLFHTTVGSELLLLLLQHTTSTYQIMARRAQLVDPVIRASQAMHRRKKMLSPNLKISRAFSAPQVTATTILDIPVQVCKSDSLLTTRPLFVEQIR